MANPRSPKSQCWQPSFVFLLAGGRGGEPVSTLRFGVGGMKHAIGKTILKFRSGWRGAVLGNPYKTKAATDDVIFEMC